MGEREFQNPYEDYDGVSRIYDFNLNKLGDEIKEPLLKNIFALLQTLEKHLISERKSSDSTVYTGNPGIALLYMHLIDSGLNSGKRDFLSDALSYVEPFIPKLKMEDFTFLCGDSGPLAITAALYQRKGLQAESLNLAQKVESLKQIACARDSPDELLYGRVGFLYSLLFLNKYLPGSHEARDEIIKEVIAAIFTSGQNFAKIKAKLTPLFFEWYGEFYIGAAHGFAGILYLLLQAKEFLTNDQLNLLVKPSVDFILSYQFPSGDFPVVLEEPHDCRLVHWCHGAPGVAFLFVLAYETFHDEKYLEAAKKCSDVVWRRGLLKKGYGICHGTAGNGYTHLKLFQVTKDVKYLWRALKFAEWCFDYGKHRCRTPDTPFSLFEGMAGTVYYLIDLLSPMNAAFPAFQLF